MLIVLTVGHGGILEEDRGERGFVYRVSVAMIDNMVLLEIRNHDNMVLFSVSS